MGTGVSLLDIARVPGAASVVLPVCACARRRLRGRRIVEPALADRAGDAWLQARAAGGQRRGRGGALGAREVDGVAGAGAFPQRATR